MLGDASKSEVVTGYWYAIDVGTAFTPDGEYVSDGSPRCHIPDFDESKRSTETAINCESYTRD